MIINVVLKLRPHDHQYLRKYNSNAWNELEHCSRLLQIYSLPGQGLSYHKEENVGGNHNVVSNTWINVNKNNSVEIIRTTSLHEQVCLGKNSFANYSRAVRKVLATKKIKITVVYVRQQMENQEHTQFLTAKTRAATIKTLCVPRLKLSTAFLRAVTEATNKSLSPKPKLSK